jgi:ketosteroid isomerase-like protein
MYSIIVSRTPKFDDAQILASARDIVAARGPAGASIGDPLQPGPESARALFQPDVEFHWPPSLPYGATARGFAEGRTWAETWDPLQPTEAERRLDPRVVAASEDEVVVLWRQRGFSPAGDRFDGEVLGLYRVREGKLARAQMFYFDTAAVIEFLGKARGSSVRA